MFYTGQNKIKLIARNEGKIKSYDSCVDVRAWSHDSHKRGCYLRDWIKCDMPVCVIPVCTVASFLNTMTWKIRGKAASRCHPECRSKALLDNIYTSCHAIRECLKNEEEFEKYFDEEEFETSHWPCERCLEALKSIKMFWKIIIEKILNVSVPKSDELETCSSQTESVRYVAKAWQDEIVHQALFVKNLTPLLSSHFVLKSTKGHNNVTIKRFEKDASLNNSQYKSKRKDFYYENKATETDITNSINITKPYIKTVKNVSKCTSIKLKTVDFGCNTNQKGNKKLDMYKNHLEYLQQRFNVQNDELGRLKRENIKLKIKLQNACKTCLSSSYTCSNIIPDSSHMLLKPFEAFSCEQKSPAIKDIESEMIITLKNCKNENFKQVSMLQVLHKTNEVHLNDFNSGQYRCKRNEDPIEILTRVHHTFGEIVKREINIANESKMNTMEANINASFHIMSDRRSVPTCDPSSSQATSASKFEEFETSHWPCERCLEALKSIKMFWKIIIEKILNVSVPKSDELETCSSQTESVRYVAKAWQDEIVHQALFVKNLTPLLSSHFVLKSTKGHNNVTIKRFEKDASLNNSQYKSKRKDFYYENKATETDITNSINITKPYIKTVKNVSKCTSIKLKTVDFGCNTNQKGNKELDMYKNDLEYLQQRFNVQNDELGRLKRENITLKIKLQNACKTCLSSSYTCSNIIPDSSHMLLKPFEAFSCEQKSPAIKDIESEMIITLKNCKNENFKQVSMLQVLHKTNEVHLNDFNSGQYRCKRNEDPIEILTRVHHTFGEIVKREINIANESKMNTMEANINASFHIMSDRRSVPTCDPSSSQATSASKFVSTTEVIY